MELLYLAFIILIAVSLFLIWLFDFLASHYTLIRIKRDIKRSTKHSATPPSSRTDENRSRDKLAEKKEEERIWFYNPELDQSYAEKPNDLEIVGIAKGGKWAQFVAKQKMGFIIARASIQRTNIKDDGYWVQLIKANAMSKGKEQSKGRM